MDPHAWDVTPKEAIEIQKQLRDRVLLTPLTKTPKYLGGCDVSMNRFAKDGYAGFVTLDTDLSPVATSAVEARIPFPYIPGLLSFREIPMLAQAWEALPIKPDLLVVDGIGIAHPRRLGIASHLGLVLNVPTIGCAKSVLVGTYEEPPQEPGTYSYLYHQGETVGVALRTKRNVKPVFVSPGHLITLKEAVECVFASVRGYRIPEPTRQAHNLVNEYRIHHLHENYSPL